MIRRALRAHNQGLPVKIFLLTRREFRGTENEPKSEKWSSQGNRPRAAGALTFTPVGRSPEPPFRGKEEQGGNMTRATLLSAALLTAVIPFARTSAQTPGVEGRAARADALYAKGESLYLKGMFAEAADTFREATLLAP